MRCLVVMLVACGGASHREPTPPQLQLVPLSGATRPRVAVLGIAAAPEQHQLVDRLDKQIRELVDERDDVVASAMAPSCGPSDTVCLAGLGANADFIVFGSLDATGVLTLQLYGVHTGQLGAGTSLRDGELTRGAVDKVIDSYLEQCETKLVLYGGVMTGGTVVLDDRKPETIRGNRFAIDTMVAGRHHLVITPRTAAQLAVDLDLPCDGSEYHVVRQ